MTAITAELVARHPATTSAPPRWAEQRDLSFR